MNKIKTLPLIAMIAMTILSFTNLFQLNIAGASVIIGIAFFFINKASEKQSFEGSGLDLKGIGSNLKDRKIWIWILLPLIMDIVAMVISKLFLPEYLDYVITRAGTFVSLEKVVLLVFQLAILALGEEIAWRAFFQKQLSKSMSLIPVLIISSVLFAIGHLTTGNPIVVLYNIFFVCINSILYGIIFHKTNNAWVSGIAHFIANLVSVLIL
jgi:uncharacterized protein